jgi:hypothetical protein
MKSGVAKSAAAVMKWKKSENGIEISGEISGQWRSENERKSKIKKW